MHGERDTPSLIPVLVTGIQQRRVCDAKGPFQPKDLGWLDPCDKHRDEVGDIAFGSSPKASPRIFSHTGAAS
ncbi:hypothetical protein FHW37_105144 [Neorhizobium alkalisoli]|uniref:Uncharacterized protein n=1 Tax=Neorhizobium alkalisoli TaxID=528178 RepID=A0A561QNQ4_9HYPH|nr:hypothetical protein FHW37_105144 [Neorhizobium alkalisoli]